MNTMMNIDPWSWFDDMFDAGGRVLRTMRARASGRFPPVNVFLDDNAMIVDLQLPGKSAKDVDLELEAQAVVVSDKPAPGEDGKVRTPAWSRRIDLPFRVEAAKANAKFENGILRIELPKADAQTVRKIAIA